MEPHLNQERREAHALLDMLPPEKLNAVRSLLEVMVEPLRARWRWLRSRRKRSRRTPLQRSTARVLRWLGARAFRTRRFCVSSG